MFDTAQPQTPDSRDVGQHSAPIPRTTATNAQPDVEAYPSAVVPRNSVTQWILSILDPARWVRLTAGIPTTDIEAARHILEGSDWTVLKEFAPQGSTVVLSLAQRRYQRIPSNRRNEAAAQVQALLSLHSVEARWIAVNDSPPATAGLYRWAIPDRDGARFRGAEHDAVYLMTNDPIEAAAILNSGEIRGIARQISAVAEPKPVGGRERAANRAAGLSILAGLAGGIGFGLLLKLAPHMPPVAPATLAFLGVTCLIALLTGLARWVEAKHIVGETWRDRIARTARLGWAEVDVPRYLRILTPLMYGTACAQVGVEAVVQFPDSSLAQTLTLVLAALVTFIAGSVWNRVRRTWTPPRVPWRIVAAAGWLIVIVFLARLVTDEFFGMVGVPVGQIDLDPAVIFAVAAVPLLAGIAATVAIAAMWALIYRGRFAAPMNWVMGVFFIGIAIGGFTHAVDSTLRHAAHAITTGADDDSLGYHSPWICITPNGSATLPAVQALGSGPVRKIGDFKDHLVLLVATARPGRSTPTARVIYVPSAGISYAIVAGARTC